MNTSIVAQLILVREAKGVIIGKNDYKVIKIYINYEYKKFEFLRIIKSSLRAFYFLFLKDFNLMQGHVP